MREKLKALVPHERVRGTLAILAIVSIPVAVVGYGLYRGSIALRRRLRAQVDEERAARLQSALRSYPKGTL